MIKANIDPCFRQWMDKYNLAYSIQIPRVVSTVHPSNDSSNGPCHTNIGQNNQT
jgi:hypothetical protein